jgi:hypothetical protein
METLTRLDWTKKVAIVFIIIITTYLVFQYLYTQKYMYDSQIRVISTVGVADNTGAGSGESGGFKEGLEDKEKTKDIKPMILKDLGSRTQTVNPDDYPDLTLKDFIVKSSYNTACTTGGTVSLNAVSYALERGYRYLDFEVYLVNGLPCVGYSEKPNATPTTLTSTNTVPLGQVLYTIATEAFSAPVMNTNDPLFLNLRIYSKDTTLYEMVAKSIDKNIKNRMYTYKVDIDTELKDIMGKIVVFIDVMAAPDYDSYPNCSLLIGEKGNCFNLSRYVNTESGGKLVKTVMYENLINQNSSPPSIDPETKATNSTILKVTYPEVIYNLNNPDLKIFTLEYGIHFTTVRLNIVDTNLRNYEAFFANCKKAFVPFSEVVEAFK